jgi:hypothetical protein
LNNWGKDRKGKPKYPQHWSGLNTREIAQLIDKHYQKDDKYYENMYIQIFPYFSWYVHSDPTGSINLDETFFFYLRGLSYCYINEIIINTLIVFGRYSFIDKGFPDFQETIKEMKSSAGFFIMELQILKLKSQITNKNNS